MSKNSMFNRIILISFSLFSNFIFASGKAPQLPELILIGSDFKSVDDVLAKIWASDAINMKDLRVGSSVDFAAIEKKQIRDYIDEKSIPNKEKFIVMIRYGMSDEEMVDLFIEAKEKGIGVIFFTNLNQYLKADFAEGENLTADFSRAKAVGAMGAIITRLLAAGFDYNDPRWGILSQPLLLNEAETPLIPALSSSNDGVQRSLANNLGEGPSSALVGASKSESTLEETPNALPSQQVLLEQKPKAPLLKIVGMGTIDGDLSDGNFSDEPSLHRERIFKLKSQSKKWASSFYIFDIDDNLFKLPTKIVVFEKSSGREVYVSTGDYSKIREQIGKAGIWRHFEIRGDDKTGSFRYFRPKENGNYFLDDILRALKESSPEHWVGPSFETLLSVLTDPELAKRVFFLTARGHDSEEVLEGIDKLLSYYRNKLGVKFYLPPRENIYCIGSVPKPAQAKADRLREIVSRINDMPIDFEAPKVLNVAGTAQESLHLVGFSDDDGLNQKLAEETMAKFLGSMPHVKFTLWDSSRSPATGKVLIPGGLSRPLKPVEFEEFISNLEDQLHGQDSQLQECEEALEAKAS